MDDESRAEVLRILAEAGMAETDLREFENQVVKFNATIPTGSLVKVGFQPLKESSDEDKAAIATAAEAHNKNLINCRITAFTAGRSLLGVGNPEGADGSELFKDLETIKSDPQTFTVADRDAFTGFFGRIPTTTEKDSETHVANIMEYQKKHAITYNPGKASVVNVFVHDVSDPEDASMFVTHAGLLAEADDGRLLYVEKLTFNQPYRALWFESRDQLVAYLRATYDDGPDTDYSQPIIMENDQVLSLS
ncbi:Uncharacterised protein [Arcanobacterium haemolyticum]|uniref:DUF4300 family protein n=1 Tax=Arcanobacterium haemolyticum TaxID=28264 RepID=UPI000D8F111D|nr:DUF4300 family protein [Arcanobacterium haemolyticum]SPT74343.1 Uncharacterised protein [Arcanobacterium haemolyticum]